MQAVAVEADVRQGATEGAGEADGVKRCTELAEADGLDAGADFVGFPLRFEAVHGDAAVEDGDVQGFCEGDAACVPAVVGMDGANRQFVPAAASEGEARGRAVIASLSVKVAQLVAVLLVFDVDVVEDSGEVGQAVVAVGPAQVEAAFERGVTKEAVAEVGLEVAAVEVIGVARELVQGEGGKAICAPVPVKVGMGAGVSVIKVEIADLQAVGAVIDVGANGKRRAFVPVVVGGKEDFACAQGEGDVALPAIAAAMQVEPDAAAQVFCRLQAVGTVVAGVVQGDAAACVVTRVVAADREFGAYFAAELLRFEQGFEQGKRQFGVNSGGVIRIGKCGVQAVFARFQGEAAIRRKAQFTAQDIREDEAVTMQV